MNILTNDMSFKTVGAKAFIFWFSGIVFLSILTTLPNSVKAQDPVFSQFYASPLQLNPALTGSADAPVFHLNYRNQWPSIANAYNTYALSYNQLFPKLNSGFGINLMGDIAGAGIYSATQVGISYAYQLQFFRGDMYVRLGLEGNLISKKLNWDKLIFLDQLDADTGPYDANGVLNPSSEQRNFQNINYFDLGLGALLYTPYFYTGFALKHITSPKESFLRQSNNPLELPMRIVAHAGGQIPIGKRNIFKTKSFLNPAVLFTKQREFMQLVGGMNFQISFITLGAWYRHAFTNPDAVIMNLGTEFKFVKLMYSYDLTVSQLGINSGGAHEISLIFNFENKNKGTDYNNCLKIFF